MLKKATKTHLKQNDDKTMAVPVYNILIILQSLNSVHDYIIYHNISAFCVYA